MEAIEQVAVRNEHPVQAGYVPRPSRAANGATSRARCKTSVATTTTRPGESVTRPGLTGAALEAALSEGCVEPELLGLVLAQAPIRRVLAVLAGRFVYLQGWERLGFARLGDYATERLGLSARTLYDLAHTDAVLPGLPEIESAFVCGELSWTKVRLLARVAGRGESAHWLALARGMTSAALARRVRAVDVGAVERSGVGRGDGEDGEEAWENVKIRCTSPVQGKWYRARQLAWRMVGRPVKPWECGEMIAAEVLSTIEMDADAAHAVRGVEATGVTGEETAVGGANGQAVSAIPASAGEAIPSTLPATPMPPGNSHNGSGGHEPVTTEQEVLSERPLSAPVRPTPPADSKNGSAAPEPVTTKQPVTRDHDEAAPMPSAGTERAEFPAYLHSLLHNLREADAFELDARLCRAVAFEQRLDAEIGALLALVAHEQLYRYHGFESLEVYAREHLGMAAGKARTLLRIERASALCPALSEAYREGRLSWVQAGALAPVVLIPHGDLPTREAWVEWASQVSVRRLKDDVDQALLMNATEPERFAATGGLPVAGEGGGNETHVLATGGGDTAGAATARGSTIGAASVGPTAAGSDTAGSDTTDAATAGSDAAAADTATGDTAAAAVTPAGAIPVSVTAVSAAAGTANSAGSTENLGSFPADRCSSPERQIGAKPRVCQEDTCLFFHAPQSVARLFLSVLCTVRRRIEAQTGRLPTEGEGFEAMLDHVIDVWGGYGRRLPAAHRVFERDGWRCTVPGCSSLANLHDHHIVYRSAGGSDDLLNRTTLCAWHHLRGVHGGVVRCVGKAPSDLRFELGVRPGARPLLGFGPGERRVATRA